jgi:hypothetical protein
MHSLFRKLSWLLRRRHKEAELQEELQFHLEEEADLRRQDGLEERETRKCARRELGNVTLVQENTRAAWRRAWTALPLFIEVKRDHRLVLRLPAPFAKCYA